MNYIEEIIIGFVLCALLALGVWGWIGHLNNEKLQAQIDTMKQEQGACNTANVEFKSATANQNQQINQLVAEGTARAVAASKAVAAAGAQSAQNTTKAAAILSQGVANDDCSGAKAVFNSYLKARTK